MKSRVQLFVKPPLDFRAGKTLIRLAERVLRDEGVKGLVHVIIAENELVRDLNKKFRKLDRVTDVLSFIYGDEDFWGEIYIALPQAQAQAPKWGNSLAQEMERLVVHGCLHLAGFDHKKAKEREFMQKKESHYLFASPSKV